MGRLDGKVAIVTGAGQGIGKAEALLLAAEGASVVVNDRGGLEDGRATDASYANILAAEIRRRGGAAVADHGDVSSWGDAERMVRLALDTYGKIDIVVCNAGIVRDRMIHNMTEAEWDSVVAVHLKGHFTLTHFIANHWRSEFKRTGEKPGGSLVYTTSEAGMYGNIGQPNYSAAKAGIIGLCFEAAKEFDRFGCRVNTISPRARTPMTEGTFGNLPPPENGFDGWAAENVAPWVAYLGTDATAQINGQVFVVHGGTVTLMKPWQPQATIEQQKTWTLGELDARARELFPTMSAVPASLDTSVMDYLGIKS